MKHIVIIGATSSIAEHCARLWVKEATRLTLVARDADKTNRIATDLRIRNAECQIDVVTAGFTEPRDIHAVVDGIVAAAPVDIALIAHGSLPDQQQCQSDIGAAADAILVNGTSPVLFAEAFATSMQQANRGTIALIGSVAGDRGRKSNYVYGAAKGLVARYAQGLQHRLAATAVKIVMIKPGPTDTPMTAHLKQKGAPLASVESVAETIVAGVNQGKAVIYAPSKWRWIMLVIQHLPAFIFNRMDI